MDTIILREGLRERFSRFMARGRVLLLSAPCGFGKTTAAEALLAGERGMVRLRAGECGELPAPDGDWRVLLLDELQLLTAERGRAVLCDLIRTGADRRFVLLTRGAPPDYLAAFQYAGLMEVLTAEDLLFSREDTRRLLAAHGVELPDAELAELRRESVGYPLGLSFAARALAAGAAFGPTLFASTLREVFAYFETEIYRRFDLPVRRFLLEVALFPRFDLELARIVSGNAAAGETLDWLMRNTTMFRQSEDGSYSFWPRFREFLVWELEREYTPEKRRALYARGGLYYELHENYARALECYTAGDDHSKVSELLIRNAELHPGMGHYDEMERYYRVLPESEVLASPALMQGMSMLCALGGDYAGSERWYRELDRFVRRCGRTDAAGRQARGRLAWLDISLPQRGVDDLSERIPAVFRLMTSREAVLPPFSVTSALPSIMNGGKDFSDWSRRDDLLYATLRVPVEALLGRDGVGVADCAAAESKFEKGEDVSARMLSLASRLPEIQRSGTPDIEFALVGLLARSQMDAGDPDDARGTLESLRERFVRLGQSRFLPNLDAMLARIALHTGDLDTAEEWYRRSAPRDLLELNLLRRYQYFTQAMAELTAGRADDALLTLAPLERYCAACARHIDGIHLNALTAVALHRLRDERWRERLGAALTAAAGYGFVRTLSVYGAALLPLLERSGWAGDARYLQRLTTAARRRAGLYPAFLQPPLAPEESLTPTEMQVLRLLCAGRSNAEIGEALGIRLPTVKTHVSHVLQKLGVSRRSEAESAARRLWLIE